MSWAKESARESQGPLVCANCGKVLTAEMPVVYSAALNVFHCGRACAHASYAQHLLEVTVVDVAGLLELAGQGGQDAAA